MTIRSALVALGTSIVVLAAALLLLNRYDHEVWLVLAVGIGVVAFSAVPRRVASSTTRDGGDRRGHGCRILGGAVDTTDRARH